MYTESNQENQLQKQHKSIISVKETGLTILEAFNQKKRDCRKCSFKSGSDRDSSTKVLAASVNKPELINIDGT